MKLNNLLTEFTTEFLNMQDKNTTIKLHERLKQDLLNRTVLKNLLSEENYHIYCHIHPPIFFKSKGTYYLVARHWIYCFFVDNSIFSFPCLIFHDEKLISQIQELELLECSIFSEGLASAKEEISTVEYPIKIGRKKSPSRTTEARKKAIESGRICPFCNGALLSPRMKKSYSKDKLYRVTCFNKSKGCDFYSMLTEDEFKKFEAYQLKTDEWLKLVPDKKCPKCNSGIYERIVQESDGIIEYYEKCRYHHQSTKKECKHMKEIKK